MFDVLAIGEMIIDFLPTERGLGLEAVPGFTKAAGGAPANVAIAVAKLGGRAAFLGTFAKDPFADFLLGTLQQYGVDTSGCTRTEQAKTGVAFVAVQESGEREFHFYRDPSADMLLCEADVQEELIRQARIVHVGSVTQVLPEAFAATVKALKLARANGVITSFDINFRLGIWRGREEEGRAKVMETVTLSDVLKVSEDEMEYFTGTNDLEAGSLKLLEMGPKIVLVTLAQRGVYYRTRTHQGKIPTWNVEAIDATGAGDAFVAGFLRQLSDRVQGRSLDVSLGMHEEIEEMARYANAVAALKVTRMGAIPGMPTKEEVFKFMYANRRRKRIVLGEL